MRSDLVYCGERVDDLQNGLFVIQDPKKFCFGMDAVLLSGFTRKRNANPFAILDTRNQSRHIAHTYASGNPSQPSLITSIFSVPICSATLYILIHNTMAPAKDFLPLYFPVNQSRYPVLTSIPRK